MLKKLLTLIILLNTQPVYSNSETSEYTREIGAKVLATASALSLTKENRLYICYSSQKKGRGKFWKNIKGTNAYQLYPYFLENNSHCNRENKLHQNCNGNNKKCYSGWHRKSLIHYYDSTYKNSDKNILSISDSQEVHIEFEHEKFNNKWFSYINKYPELEKIIVTIGNKFIDIFNRLYIAQQNRQKLETTFSEYQDDGINYNKYLGDVDNDIKLLSSHGIKLATVTKRLFKTIKPIVIDAEMRIATISGRKETMEGLRSFEKEMNKINKFPQTAIDDSIQEIINSIDSAIDDLEKTLSK